MGQVPDRPTSSAQAPEESQVKKKQVGDLLHYDFWIASIRAGTTWNKSPTMP